LINPRDHSPANCTFIYDEQKVVPILVRDEHGNMFSGSASGAIGQADWSGVFLDGKADGMFYICWGDRIGGRHFFKGGERQD
jgi:hypothetical protein